MLCKERIHGSKEVHPFIGGQLTWKHGEGSIPKDVVEWVEKVIEKL